MDVHLFVVEKSCTRGTTRVKTCDRILRLALAEHKELVPFKLIISTRFEPVKTS